MAMATPDVKAHQVVHEDRQRWILRSPTGHTFAVAKKGLSPKYHEVIRALGPQGMALGGGVEKSIAEPEALAPLPQTTPETPTQPAGTEVAQLVPQGQAPGAGQDQPLPEIGLIEKIGDYAKSHFDPAEHWYSPLEAAVDPLHAIRSAVAAPGAIEDLASGKTSVGGVRFDVSATDKAQAKKEADAQFAADRAAGGVGAGPGGESGGTPGKPGVAPGGQAGVGAGGPARAGVTGGAPAQPATPDALSKVDAEEKAAADAQAKAAQMQGDAEAQAQAEAAKQRESISSDFKSRMEQHATRQQQMFDDIASTEIDPNRVWHNMTTGGRISAGIGMVLSALGGGATGQPSQAMAVLDKTVDRDIDAQKADLGKKQSLLSHYMEQGHDMQSAYQLTKADLMDATAGKLAMVAAKLAGPKAAAQADAMKAAISKSTYQMRQQAEAQRASQQLAQAHLGLQQRMLDIRTAAASQPPVDVETRATRAEAEKGLAEASEIYKKAGMDGYWGPTSKDRARKAIDSSVQNIAMTYAKQRNMKFAQARNYVESLLPDPSDASWSRPDVAQENLMRLRGALISGQGVANARVAQKRRGGGGSSASGGTGGNESVDDPGDAT